MRKRIFVICVVVFGLLIAGCGQTPAAPSKLKIAISSPTNIGWDNIHAAELALQKAGGKAGPYEVELVIMDEYDASAATISVEKVVKNAEEAVKDPSIVGWVGPDGSRSARQIIPILNRASIAIISGTNTWPGLTKVGYGPGEPGIYYPTGKQNYFRTVASDEVQGSAAAKWIKDLGFSKVYVLHASDVYGTGIAGILDLAAGDLGLTVLGNETFEAEAQIAPDVLQGMAAKALDTKPEIVYIAGGVGSNAENIIRALRQINPAIPIMGPDGMATPNLISELGAEMVDNIYGTAVALPAENLDAPAGVDFFKSYETAYGKPPTSFDAAIYEATNVMLAAISRAKEPTREAVLDSLLNLGDYTGVYGTWHFDPQGDISFEGVSGLQVQNGSWVFVKALK